MPVSILVGMRFALLSFLAEVRQMAVQLLDASRFGSLGTRFDRRRAEIDMKRKDYTFKAEERVITKLTLLSFGSRSIGLP